MTHAQAVAALAENTAYYKAGAISYPDWSREVDRILAARFPGEPFQPYAPRGERKRRSTSTRTNTPPGTQLREAGYSPAQAAGHAAEPGGS